MRAITESASKLLNVYKKYGFLIFCKKLYAYVVANYFNKISFDVMLHPRKYREQIREMLSSDYDRVVLWRSSFGYEVPLYQRPQHISRNLAKNRCLVLYEVTTMTDRVKTLRRRHENLWLFNFNNLALSRILMEELGKVPKPRYVQLYSTDWKLSVQDIEMYLSNGFGFIYEYIDHISPDPEPPPRPDRGRRWRKWSPRCPDGRISKPASYCRPSPFCWGCFYYTIY